jgi:hypothetical protein
MGRVIFADDCLLWNRRNTRHILLLSTLVQKQTQHNLDGVQQSTRHHRLYIYACARLAGTMYLPLAPWPSAVLRILNSRLTLASSASSQSSSRTTINCKKRVVKLTMTHLHVHGILSFLLTKNNTSLNSSSEIGLPHRTRRLASPFLYSTPMGCFTSSPHSQHSPTIMVYFC